MTKPEWKKAYMYCPGCGEFNMASNLDSTDPNRHGKDTWLDICLICRRQYQIHNKAPAGPGVTDRIREETT